MSDLPFDEIGNWSEIKLDIIREYAAAYSKILDAQGSISRHVYIDAFAGWGTHISKTTGEAVPGSPLIALNVEPPFTEYHFIDLDDRRVERLTELANARDDISVYQGDCNTVLLSSVFTRCEYSDYARTLSARSLPNES